MRGLIEIFRPGVRELRLVNGERVVVLPDGGVLRRLPEQPAYRPEPKNTMKAGKLK